MPTSCSIAAAAMTTSASRSVIEWSATITGSTPRRNSNRERRSAMFTTIWMCTQEWSDMCSRSALRACIRHHAFT